MCLCEWQGVRDVFGRGLNGVVKKRSSQGVEIDASDVDGNMPLMRVVLGNKKAAASALLAGDADANVKNLEQDSAVWLTDREDAGDIVKLFAQHDSAADAQNNEGDFKTFAPCGSLFLAATRFLL